MTSYLPHANVYLLFGSTVDELYGRNFASALFYFFFTDELRNFTQLSESSGELLEQSLRRRILVFCDLQAQLENYATLCNQMLS